MKFSTLYRFACSLAAVLVLSFAISSAYIQVASAQTTPPLAHQSAPPPKAPTAPPALTQTEQLQIENIGLRFQLLQNEEGQLRSQYAALAAQIGKENPGYLLDPKTNMLVKAQPAPEKTKK
jgi:hypothetical protein